MCIYRTCSFSVLGVAASTDTKRKEHSEQTLSLALTFKAPITTAAAVSFPIFDKNKVWYYMRIVCQQLILMKYHALFVIFEKAAKF